MLSDTLIKILKPTKRLSNEIDHFSIQKVGVKFYLYAHPLKGGLNKKKIGTFKSYEDAKKAVDTILDLKIRDINL